MSGVHPLLLENALSRTRTHATCFRIKGGINPFYNVRKKNVNSIQGRIFFVIVISLSLHAPVECMVSTLLGPRSIVRFFNCGGSTRSTVCTLLWCF